MQVLLYHRQEAGILQFPFPKEKWNIEKRAQHDISTTRTSRTQAYSSQKLTFTNLPFPGEISYSSTILWANNERIDKKVKSKVFLKLFFSVIGLPLFFTEIILASWTEIAHCRTQSESQRIATARLLYFTLMYVSSQFWDSGKKMIELIPDNLWRFSF